MADSSLLRLQPDQCSLRHIFGCGQVFLWNEAGGAWRGVLDGREVRLAQTGDEVTATGADAARLARFLRLEVSLRDVFQQPAASFPELQHLAVRHAGLRVVRQEPVECCLSFVCAVVTNIPRIRMSLAELCRRFGPQVGEGLWAFPDLDVLADAPVTDLRVGGLEFRARSLSRAARELRALGGNGFLLSLRDLAYEEAHRALQQIPHVGPKVADCVLLFSLGFDEAFPLDTHSWRRGERLLGLEGSSRTLRGYRELSGRLREALGPCAGWVQQYLYYDSLLEGRRAARAPVCAPG